MDQLKASEQYVEDDKWSQEGMNSHEHVGYNFVEMTNLPKKIEAKSVVSLIAFASRIVPAAVDICSRADSNGHIEPAAIVEFKSEIDAFRAVDKVKSTAFGKRWQMRIIRDPKRSNT